MEDFSLTKVCGAKRKVKGHSNRNDDHFHPVSLVACSHHTSRVLFPPLLRQPSFGSPILLFSDNKFPPSCCFFFSSFTADSSNSEPENKYGFHYFDRPVSFDSEDDEEMSEDDAFDQRSCSPSCCDRDCDCDDCVRCSNTGLFGEDADSVIFQGVAG